MKKKVKEEYFNSNLFLEIEKLIYILKCTTPKSVLPREISPSPVPLLSTPLYTERNYAVQYSKIARNI